MYRRALQMFMIANNMTPNYLTSKQPSRKRQYLFSAGESLSFRQLRYRTSRYFNSFFPDGISTWNNVIGNFDSMPSIGVFKAHLLSLYVLTLKVLMAFMIH